MYKKRNTFFKTFCTKINHTYYTLFEFQKFIFSYIKETNLRPMIPFKICIKAISHSGQMLYFEI